jgi:hypothetical protein
MKAADVMTTDVLFVTPEMTARGVQPSPASDRCTSRQINRVPA